MFPVRNSHLLWTSIYLFRILPDLCENTREILVVLDPTQSDTCEVKLLYHSGLQILTNHRHQGRALSSRAVRCSINNRSRFYSATSAYEALVDSWRSVPWHDDPRTELQRSTPSENRFHGILQLRQDTRRSHIGDKSNSVSSPGTSHCRSRSESKFPCPLIGLNIPINRLMLLHTTLGGINLTFTTRHKVLLMVGFDHRASNSPSIITIVPSIRMASMNTSFDERTCSHQFWAC